VSSSRRTVARSIAAEDPQPREKLIDVHQYRPGRNFIRVGDPVRVILPRRQSFDATIHRMRANSQGEVVQVDVVGCKNGRCRAIRIFTPDRIARRARVTAMRKGGSTR
jgi:hypothetical protein